MESLELSELVMKFNAGNNNLQPAETLRCRSYYGMQFDALEYLYYQNLDGSIPPRVVGRSQCVLLKQDEKTLGYTSFWEENSIAYADHSIVIFRTG
jgi:hypothetical protein